MRWPTVEYTNVFDPQIRALVREVESIDDQEATIVRQPHERSVFPRLEHAVLPRNAVARDLASGDRVEVATREPLGSCAVHISRRDRDHLAVPARADPGDRIDGEAAAAARRGAAR